MDHHRRVNYPHHCGRCCCLLVFDAGKFCKFNIVNSLYLYYNTSVVILPDALTLRMIRFRSFVTCSVDFFNEQAVILLFHRIAAL